MKVLFGLLTLLFLTSTFQAFGDPNIKPEGDPKKSEADSPDCNQPGSSCIKNFTTGRLSPTQQEAKAKADSLLGSSKPEDLDKSKSGTSK